MVVKEGNKRMSIAKYITNETVLFFGRARKREIVNALITKAGERGLISDKAAFRGAIEEREMKLSTGIGNGVAIPHAKIKGVNDFFVLTAVIESAIEWEAIDQKPVSLVFLIGGPEDKQSEYLQILSQIMVFVRKESTREAIMTARSEAEIVAIFNA